MDNQRNINLLIVASLLALGISNLYTHRRVDRLKRAFAEVVHLENAYVKATGDVVKALREEIARHDRLEKKK